MKAVVLEEQGVINVREVPDVPAPGLGELKIAPHTVGVCGSDLHYSSLRCVSLPLRRLMAACAKR